MTPNSFTWITTFLGPISDVLISAMFLYGALRSRFRVPFGLIASAGLFIFVSHAFWLVFQLQQGLGVELVSKEILRMLFPLQALSLYIGVIIVVVGDVMLIWQVSRTEPERNI